MNNSVTNLIFSAVLPVLACGQSDPVPPTGPRATPSATARMYVLKTVAGEPVPAAVVDNEYATILTLADTLWLEADGTGLEVASERSTDKGRGALPVAGTYARPFSYSLEGRRIEVSFECNDVVIRSCVAPPHYRGMLTELHITLDNALNYRTPLVYDRVVR